MADGAPIEAEGDGPPQARALQGGLVGEQAEIADLEGRALAFPQLVLQGCTVQGGLLVNFEAGGKQHIHFATG